MGIKSKRKGKAFEDEVAKILTDWSGQVFKRLPASGALRWGGRTWTYGDLLPPEGWPLVVECKHHHDVRMEDLLGTARSGPQDAALWHWWQQADQDAKRAEAELGTPTAAIVVWKRDYGQPRITTTEANLIQPAGVPFFLYRSSENPEGLYTASLYTLLKAVSPSDFHTLLLTSFDARPVLVAA